MPAMVACGAGRQAGRQLRTRGAVQHAPGAHTGCLTRTRGTHGLLNTHQGYTQAA